MFSKKICPRCFKKIGLLEKVLYKDKITALRDTAGDITPYSWREIWHKKCATPEELALLKKLDKEKKGRRRKDDDKDTNNNDYIYSG